MALPIVVALALGACGSPAPAAEHGSAPSHVEHPESEGDLAVVHLAPEAIARLGIETATVEERATPATRLVGGEVVVPPGRVVTVTAPVPGTLRLADGATLTPGAHVTEGQLLLRLVPLAPVDRDVRARADRELGAARAQLEVAEARVARVEQLVAEHAGSQRLLDEAAAARDVARADLAQAQARSRTTRDTPLLADVSMTVRAPDDGLVRTLAAANGQSVAAGAVLLEIVAVESLEVRVPVYSGDLARIDADAPASIEPLGGGSPVLATAVPAPPTADALAGTVDRYFALGPEARFSLGERVLVALALRDDTSARALPYASVVHDAGGGAWVYACDGEGAYRRTRVDPIRVEGDRILVAQGPPVGACVVSVGAPEIFGAEFPPGH